MGRTRLSMHWRHFLIRRRGRRIRCNRRWRTREAWFTACLSRMYSRQEHSI